MENFILFLLNSNFLKANSLKYEMFIKSLKKNIRREKKNLLVYSIY
jgi:hypothetical protein